MKRTTPLTRHIGGKVREYRLKNGLDAEQN